MLTLLLLFASVISGLTGGVFYAFSTFVMRALEDQPAAAGIAAMQRINVTVLTPLFLGPFFAPAMLLATAAYLARSAGHLLTFIWLTLSLLLYIVGSIGVTIFFNVPRNNKLASLAPDSDEAAAYWPIYIREHCCPINS
ncbi:MAG TPA: anthrone oxygenase family protein [Wenzhouxiangella sp.]|nr:anthrone oxygenase family protein [Wenzhouxiangella sp.]